ncbi:uncharacterized protein LOC122648180, partial [Telopea speciosissima]|uniref:uncharacterized protein LOC122648180 n=1 Tax=Telopea speciosissima TaxID=54955 RepID=UPI001CC5DC64
SIKTRRSHNHIFSIQNYVGEWITDEDEIRRSAADFFEEYFMGTPQVICQPLCLPVYRSLDISEVASLSREFTTEEIKVVVFVADDDSAPDTDGFGTLFFKETWEVTRMDVTDGILDFFNNLTMPEQLKLSRLMLVPKGASQNSFNNFWPVAVSSLLYRFIAKLLVNRIKLVLHKLVGPNQSAFMEGRQISNNILLCQELLHDYHCDMGMPRFVAKLDLLKAYDSVQWSFWFTLLNYLNFPP